MDRIHHSHMHRHTRREGAVDVHEVARRTAAVVQEASRVVLAPRATCTNDTDDGCRKPTQTPTLFIVLAVAYVYPCPNRHFRANALQLAHRRCLHSVVFPSSQECQEAAS